MDPQDFKTKSTDAPELSEVVKLLEAGLRRIACNGGESQAIYVRIPAIFREKRGVCSRLQTFFETMKLQESVINEIQQ